MIRGINDKGEIKTAAMTDDGKLKVEVSGGGSGDNQVKIVNEDTSPVPVKLMSGVTIPDNFEVNNDAENPIPVSVTNQVGGEEETTLKSDYMTVGTTSSTINLVENMVFTDKNNTTRTFPIPSDLLNFGKDIAIQVDDVLGNAGYVYCYDSTEPNCALWGSSAAQIKLDGRYKKYRMDGTSYVLNASSDSQSSSITIGPVGRIIYHTSTIKVSGSVYEEATGTNPYNEITGKKITSIDIANYSESGTVTLTAGELEAEVGNSLAVSLPINKDLIGVSLVASEADTPVQVVIKGVEE